MRYETSHIPLEVLLTHAGVGIPYRRFRTYGNANLEPHSGTRQVSGSIHSDPHEIRKDEFHDSKL